jgi:hypothetical protein
MGRLPGQRQSGTVQFEMVKGKTDLNPSYPLRSRSLSLFPGGTNYRLFCALIILMFTNFCKEYYHAWLLVILLLFKTPGNKIEGDLFLLLALLGCTRKVSQS